MALVGGCCLPVGFKVGDFEWFPLERLNHLDLKGDLSYGAEEGVEKGAAAGA